MLISNSNVYKFIIFMCNYNHKTRIVFRFLWYLKNIGVCKVMFSLPYRQMSRFTRFSMGAGVDLISY